jgi:hypothetical protein
MPERTRDPDIERELRERQTDEKRQSSGTTPTEDEIERAIENEPVEWHAGEDAGEVPPREDEEK